MTSNVARVSGFVLLGVLCVVGFVLGAAFSLSSEPCGLSSCDLGALNAAVLAALLVPVVAAVAVLVVCFQDWRPLSPNAVTPVVWATGAGVAVVLGLAVWCQWWSTGGRYPIW